MNKLQQCLEYVQDVTESKLCCFKRQLPNGTTAEKVIAILMAASQVRHKDIRNPELIQRAVKWAVRNNQPVNISMFWALEAHARTQFQIVNWQYCVPRFGEIWGIHWLHLLEQKVRVVYPPGLKFVLIDETRTSKMVGWEDDDMNLRRSIFAGLIPDVSNLVVVNAPRFECNGTHPPVDPRQVFSFLVSSELLNLAQQQAITSILKGMGKEIDWAKIQEFAGADAWGRAVSIAQHAKFYSETRKKTDWVRQMIFSGDPYIDGCMRREGRWSPNIWDESSPQHGGALVNLTDPKFTVKIRHESRLLAEGATPHRVPVRDFQHFTDLAIPYDGEVELYWQ